MESEKKATKKVKNPYEPNIQKYVKERKGDDEYNLEIIKDYDGSVDLFYLNKKDPNYEYRFLRADDKNLSTKTTGLIGHKGGWQLVPKSHLLRIGIKESELLDGLYRIGDTVLAFMPKELFKKKLKLKKEQADAPMRAVRRMMKEGTDDAELKAIGTRMKGLQPEKDLGGNFK